MNKNRRHYQKLLTGLGVTIVEEGTTGRSHLKFVVTYKGKSRGFFPPSSGSDSLRGDKNFVGEVRRWMKDVDAGVF